MNKYKIRLSVTEKLILLHLKHISEFPVTINDIVLLCGLHYSTAYKNILSLAEKDLVDLITDNKKGVPVEVYKKGILG